VTDLDVPPEQPPRMPPLSDEELQALPAPRAIIVRLLGGLALFALGLASVFLLYPHSSGPTSAGENAHELALRLAPWVLVFPWLRGLDVRRVPWFFLCLISPLLGPILLASVGYRALSLPYRTWRVSYWHAHRARRIPSTRTWVLLGADRVSEPVLSVGLVRWERFERVAWVFFMASAATFKVWKDPLDTMVGGLWLAGLLALAVGPLLVDWLLRIRQPKPQPQ